METQKKNKSWLIAAAILLVLAIIVGLIIYHNTHFKTVFYTVDSPKVDNGFRIVQLSDLHQKSFGHNNADIIQKVSSLKPDIIILSGDIIDSDYTDTSYAVNLCKRLLTIAPVIYAYGNHENGYIYGMDLNKAYLEGRLEPGEDGLPDLDALEIKKDFRSELEDAGVVVLSNSALQTEINGTNVDIGAVSTNLSSFYDCSGDFTWEFLTTYPENFKLFICHRPDVVDKYLDEYPIDLALCGHTHGGVIRLPNGSGLIDTDRGFNCQYPEGKYDMGNKVVIISRGFAGAGAIPRINNSPELVVIDVR